MGMRTVALISGGKDSCYNMMKCVAAGHEIVALANLQPSGRDELDSFMFQTVGHEGVSLVAEAMGLPLYRAHTKGISLARDLHYSCVEGDEVEDLFQLLSRVKEEVGVEAVSSGAVLSNYQRLRVENVCSRLGLVSLAYLWQRNQAELLREMIDAGVNAIVIKVASMGLVPEKHLGRNIKDLYPELCKLNERYGINVCGEGGEYETFTLDCPLFHKEILLEQFEVVAVSENTFAPVAYLRMGKLLLRSKKPLAEHGVGSVEESCRRRLADKTDKPMTSSSDLCPCLLLSNDRQTQCVVKEDTMWLSWEGDGELQSVSEQTSHLFSELEAKLTAHHHSWSHVALVYLYLSSMADYPTVNAIYSAHFPSQPPARVCVATSLPRKVLVKIEAIVWKPSMTDGEEGTGSGRSSLHVQSHSEWAPANIGPYSQAYTISKTVLGAGQIGLDPARMTLVGVHDQPSLSLTHSQTVLSACSANLNSALCGICYFTTEESAWVAMETWKQWLKGGGEEVGCPLMFVGVSDDGLPRGAAVEWHFVAVTTPHRPKYSSNCCFEEGLGACVVVHESWCQELSLGCWMITFALAPCSPFLCQHNSSDIREVIRKGLTRLKSLLESRRLHLSHLTYLRLCVPKYGAPQKPISASDVASLCQEVEKGQMDRGDFSQDVGVSLLVTEGFSGLNCSVSIQACLLCSNSEYVCP